MSWRGVLGWVLLAAAILSGWSAWRQRDRALAGDADDNGADYVLRDFEMTALDKDTGKVALVLRAPEMHRDRADEISHITTPLFLIPDNNDQEWTLRAKTGWLSPSGDELRLREDVMGDSPTTGNVPPTTLRTESLDVFPKRNLAKTAEPVTMTRPGIIQRGVGFEADLKTRQYQLLSQVKTRYEPNAAK
ncbi:LPS export ABC transporter periplasmic protein LptC [[Pseudomonas] boreopolis]|uniref:LPS export ABC transporter periplasmic protein LptC n=1 Tax=Xanthomonas boreopolis TaxID=86183 RepID=UPI003D40C7FC